MIKEVTVTIGTALKPDPIHINAGDIVVWANATATVQTVNSDTGQSFTTGAIQPNENSLPITVPGTTTYTVTPANLHGAVKVAHAASRPST
jgi:plastocyanin